MTTLHLRLSNSRSPLRLGFLFIPFALAYFALAPTAQAQLPSPTPDGGYPGENTAEGTNALFSLTIGGGNTAIGYDALTSNTGGNHNTATGDFALSSNTIGGYNTANGLSALRSNKDGYNNTAGGVGALYSNTSGGNNTANGYAALYSNTSGGNNTANGYSALLYNTTGSSNTANGIYALFSNKGSNNTANGASALLSNQGNNNTASGVNALYHNTTGSDNTASGLNALNRNASGGDNTAIGAGALYFNTSGIGNSATGFQALLNNTGSNNIGLGSNAGSSLTTGSGNVCIGQGVLGVAGESNTTRIRNVYSSVASERPVYVNSNNKIGTLVSSRRFKDEIKPMDKASETILALKPVTFRYKKEIEPNGAIMFGLIAEEVEKVDPDLVTRNDKGEVEAVRYEAVNAMLLNEFLKEHRTVQELKKEIAALTAGLQKVSAQVEMSKPAPQMVVND